MLALTFQIGADRVAIDVRRVRRVVPCVELSAAPAGSPALAGLFVYRGQVVPVIDLFRLAGVGSCPSQLSSRIVLVPHPEGTDRLIGLLAAQVADIRELPTPSTDDEFPPPTAYGLGSPIADGTTVFRILDADRLLAAFGSTGFASRPTAAGDGA